MQKQEKWTYIAGPMRGYPQFNFPAFFDAEESLARLGWKSKNPARMDLEQDATAATSFVHPVEVYVKRDIEALLFLKQMERVGHKVAVHFLEGWHKSKGARAEHAVAEWLEIERIYL